MSLSQPNAYLPARSAACSTAVESVFWRSTSAPWFMSDCAASVSFGGSNQEPTQMTLVFTFGFTLCAPSVYALMLRSTSGIGNEATNPRVFDFVILPATIPARYAPS
jgi:hypothetical protein